MTSLRLPLSALQETLEIEHNHLLGIVHSRCICLYDVLLDSLGVPKKLTLYVSDTWKLRRSLGAVFLGQTSL